MSDLQGLTSEATVKLLCVALVGWRGRPERNPIPIPIRCNRPVRFTGFCKECGNTAEEPFHEWETARSERHQVIPEVIHVDEGGPCAWTKGQERCGLWPEARWHQPFVRVGHHRGVNRRTEHEYVAPPLALGHEAEVAE